MINSIVAFEKNKGIGYNNAMPWPFLQDDLKYFKLLTTNNVVIMGSNTWKSLKYKPLPNRINIVLSKTHSYSGNDRADHTFSDPESALIFCDKEYQDKEIFIIGGQQVYDITMPLIDRFFITEIDKEYTCDKFFNFDYVLKNFEKTKIIGNFNNPVNYTIKEYTK